MMMILIQRQKSLGSEGSNPSLTALLGIKESSRGNGNDFGNNDADDENRDSESNSPKLPSLTGLAYKRTVRFRLLCTWVTEWIRFPYALPHFPLVARQNRWLFLTNS